MASNKPATDANLAALLETVATQEGLSALAVLMDAVRSALTGKLAVGADTLPLPSGAATENKLEAVRAILAAPLGVTATSLPLPTNAATDAKLEAVRALLAAPLATLPTNTGWTSWTAATAFDARNYVGVEIQVLTNTGAITLTRSGNNANYVSITAQDASFNQVSPSAAGFFQVIGGAWLKWAGTGTVLIRGFN